MTSHDVLMKQIENIKGWYTTLATTIAICRIRSLTFQTKTLRQDKRKMNINQVNEK